MKAIESERRERENNPSITLHSHPQTYLVRGLHKAYRLAHYGVACEGDASCKDCCRHGNMEAGIEDCVPAFSGDSNRAE